MTTAARNPLRRKWREGKQTAGLWATMECPSITEIAVTFGLDWVCVDMEHGHLGYKEVMEHVRTARGSELAVLVRVPDVRMDSIKRALDIGAHGVLLPLIRNREQLEEGFRYGRYPLEGVRGIGGERNVKWGLGLEEYVQYANEETLIVPLIETKEAVEDIDRILQVKGLEAIFFGPADLSATYGYLGQWEGPGVADIILQVKDKARSAGIVSGVMGTSADNAKFRMEQGFGMVGLGSDAGLMIRAIRHALERAGRDAAPHLWF